VLFTFSMGKLQVFQQLISIFHSFTPLLTAFLTTGLESLK